MMKADGSKEVNLTLQPARDSYPAFSPDGARILFYSDRDGGIETLYFLDVATREVTPVPGVGPGPNHSASWAPDGSWIAYESRRDGRLQIYALDLRDRVERRLTSHDGEDLLPQISPDGSRIVSGSRRAGNEEIHVMNADGSGEINLTRGPSTDLAPRWSPDGAIVYVSDISGRWAFHLMRDDGRATGREPLSFPAGTR
jgi:Tol biopolymer transport system component